MKLKHTKILQYFTLFKKPTLLFGFFVFISFQSICQLVVQGNVKDQNNDVIPYALIEIHELNRKTQSDLNGNFTFNEIIPNVYHFHISCFGYEYLTKEISITSETKNLNFILEESLNELHEVVIENSIFKKKQSENSLAIISFSEDEIQNSGSPTLSNALENIEGVQSINTGVGISKPVIRGFSSNRILVNDAGIKQEGQQWGADHGLEIDQFNIENIEVIKGPMALAYGSDALAGVINIKRNGTTSNNSLTTGINGFYRSVNNTLGETAFLKANKNNHSIRMRVTNLAFGDYKVPTNSYSYKGFLLPIENNQLKNTAGNELNTSIGIGITKKWGFSQINFTNFNQKTGIFPGSTGIPQGYSLKDDQNSRNIELPYQSTNHAKIISNNSFSILKKWVELDLGFQFNDRIEASKPHQHGIPIDTNQTIATHLKLYTTTLNAKIHHKTTEKIDWISGIQSQMQENKISGYEFILPNYKSHQLGLYTLVNKHISSKNILNTGLRLEYANQKSSETKRPFYSNLNYIDSIVRSPAIHRNYLNFAFGIGLASEISDEKSLKINLGKTFRTPQMIELTANGSHLAAFRYEKGNSKLNPEEAFQFDINYNIERKKYHFAISSYVNYFTNFIYLAPTASFAGEWINGDFYNYTGGGQIYEYKQTIALHTGFEANFHLHVHESITMGSTIEYVHTSNLKTNTALPFMPPLALKPFIEWLTKPNNKKNNYGLLKFQTNLSHEQNRVDINENTTQGYTTCDFHAGLGKRKSRHKIQLNFSVLNVFNKKYLNHLSRYRIANLPEPGRSFNLSLNYTFL